MSKKDFVTLLFLLVSLVACNVSTTGQPPEPEPQAASASLEIKVVDKDMDEHVLELALDYYRDEKLVGPRVMELFVRHANTLQYLNFAKAKAVELAGKELLVQRRDDQTLRVVMYASSNLNTLDSGRIALLRFRVLEKTSTVVELVADRPVFAPASANEGLILSDPLHLWSEKS